jgi:hypothetical protein
MMIFKISFVVNAIIHASFVEDRQNMNVKHVSQIEIDILQVKKYNIFHWFNVSVFLI